MSKNRNLCKEFFTWFTSGGFAKNYFTTPASITSHSCRTRVTEKTFLSIIVARHTYQNQKQFYLSSLSETEILFCKQNIPRKQGFSRHVMNLVQFLPSPEVPTGHGPHFGPVVVSVQSTPIKSYISELEIVKYDEKLMLMVNNKPG